MIDGTMWEALAEAMKEQEIEAGGGMLILESTTVADAHYPPLDPDRVTVICGDGIITGNRVAAALKAVYPADHLALIILNGAPTQKRVIGALTEAPLSKNTLILLPPRSNNWSGASGFLGLMESMAMLLSEEGCPWDRKQTHESLLKYLQEEAYEVIDAVTSGDPGKVTEELGDVLLQILFHAEIGRRDGEFTMTDVIRTLDAKLKRRHPHVWGDVEVAGDPAKVLEKWGEIKAAERAENGETKRESLLDRVPKSLPALDKAHQYDSLAASVGFDWDTLEGAIEKLKEEIVEVEEARTPEEKLGEVGDILFVGTVIARWLDVNPEAALRAANRRFYERFSYIERRAEETGRTMKDMTLDEMEAFWQEAKRNGFGT